MNKDPYIVPEEDPLIILDTKSSVCMDKNFKDTNHTRHISRRLHFVRNSEILKIHNIDWCGGGMKLADIETNNVGDHYLNNIMKYIMAKLEK